MTNSITPELLATRLDAIALNGGHDEKSLISAFGVLQTIQAEHPDLAKGALSACDTIRAYLAGRIAPMMSQSLQQAAILIREHGRISGAPGVNPALSEDLYLVYAASQWPSASMAPSGFWSKKSGWVGMEQSDTFTKKEAERVLECSLVSDAKMVGIDAALEIDQVQRHDISLRRQLRRLRSTMF